jgi:hypothetical protein
MAERMVEVIGWKDPIGDGLYNMGVTDERIIRCRDCKYMHIVRKWTGLYANECWLHASEETGALGKEQTEPD